MIKLDKDFDFILELLEGFFQKEHIQENFNAIHNLRIIGWENWLQIELALYLNNNNHIDSWYYDKVEMNSTPTIYILEKGFIQDYIILDLKQYKDCKQIIEYLIKYSGKLLKILATKNHLRSFWDFIIHPTKCQDKMEKIFVESKKEHMLYSEHLVKTRHIPNTNFSYTIF